MCSSVVCYKMKTYLLSPRVTYLFLDLQLNHFPIKYSFCGYFMIFIGTFLLPQVARKKIKLHFVVSINLIAFLTYTVSILGYAVTVWKDTVREGLRLMIIVSFAGKILLKL